MRTHEIATETLLCARRIFDYLALASSELPCVDVIIGFGHFDPDAYLLLTKKD